jgi:hypothetical protein
MNTVTEMVITIAGLLVALAAFTVAVSKKAQTPAVVQALASGFNNALGVAEAPVTGVAYHTDLTYPGSDFTGSFGGVG